MSRKTLGDVVLESAVLRWAAIALSILAMVLAIRAIHQQTPPDHFADCQWRFQSLNPAGLEKPVEFPHNWSSEHEPIQLGRYTGTFQLESLPEEAWAVYLPSLSMNAAVRINGIPIGDGGRMTPPIARQTAHPLYFRVDSRLLRAGENTLEIELAAATAGSGYLMQAYVGAEKHLQPRFRYRYSIKTSFAQAIIIVLVVTGLIFLALWLGRRHERVYLWQGICAFVAASVISLLVLDDGLLTGRSLECALAVCLIWTTASCTQWTFHYLRLDWPRLLHMSLVTALILTLAVPLLALAWPEFFDQEIRFIKSIALGFILVPLFFGVRFLRVTDWISFWVMVSGLTIGGMCMRDVLMLLEWVAPYDGYWTTYTCLLAVIVFSWALLQRFMSTLNEAEMLNLEMSERVQLKEIEIRKSYDQLRAEGQRRSLAEERERLLRDMHDGAGGQLVSLLARLENEGKEQTPVAEAVRGVLQDLRLIIFSLEPDAQDLRSALAMLRDRLVPACKSAGLEVEWDLSGLTEQCLLGPRNTLHVLRIVSEAVTNVLKHAGASQLTVRAEESVKDLAITVEDNGVGLSAATKPHGKGLHNMRHRASMLHGALEILERQSGVCVRLRVPVAIDGRS